MRIVTVMKKHIYVFIRVVYFYFERFFKFMYCFVYI